MSIILNIMDKIYKMNFQNSFLLFFALSTIFFFNSGCKNDYETIKAKKIRVSEPSDNNVEIVTRENSSAKPYSTLLHRRDSVIIKKTENASANFRNAITYQNSDWGRSYYLGRSFLSQEKYVEALAHLKTALDHVDRTAYNRYRIYLSLGECYEKLGDDQQALLAFYTASNINPDSREAFQGVQRLRQTAQLK